MTSYERIYKAMRFQAPDRVPVMCQLSQGYMSKNGGVKPLDVYTSAEGAAYAFFKTRRDLGFDGIVLNIAFSDDWRDFYDNIKSIPIEGGEKLILPDGREYEQQGNNLIQTVVPLVEEKPNIDNIDPDEVLLRLDYTDMMVLHRMAVEQGEREQFSVHGEIVSPYDCFVVLLGLEEAMMALITDSDKCKSILSRYVQQCFSFAKAQIDVGVDAIKISSPFAGGSFISLDFYQEFVLPFEREVVTQIHAYRTDMPVYTHTCGFIGDRLELMAATGINGLECMDPPPLGNTTLSDAKHRVGNKLFLKGNMDSVNALLNANEHFMEGYIKQMIGDGAEGGGYILSTACSVAPNVKPEVLKMLVPLAEKYGAY